MRRFIRTVLSLVTLLSLLTPITAAQAEDTPGVADALVLIHVNHTEEPGLPIAGPFLVAEVPDGHLAFLDDHERGRLERPEYRSGRLPTEEGDLGLVQHVA